MSDKIAIILPAYNEEITIAKVIEDHHKILPEATIFVYDNCSTDKTASIAASFDFVIVRNEPKAGKGNVIRTAFREIDADIYIMNDSDDTYPPDKLPEMIGLVNQGYDMVVGDRLSSTYFTENKRHFHNSGNKTVRFLINKLFHSNVKDIMSGLRVFNRSFVKTFPIISTGFEIETEMTIHTLDKNLNIAEVKVDYRDRPEGSFSKLSTFQDGIMVLGTILLLFKEYKAMLFFTIVSFLFAIPGFYGLIIAIIDILTTSAVKRVPTLMLGVLCLIVSLLSFVAGLILSIVHKKSRETFELFRLSLK
jgi:glycosyltransferase involved in cell wall biosynthesis